MRRGQYAAFIAAVAAMIVLTFASHMVLQSESRSPDANITTAGDAPWWAIVTINDRGLRRVPVTAAGRVTGVFVMFADVGVIGALASILAPSAEGEEHANVVPGSDAVQSELIEIKRELAAFNRSLGAGGAGGER